MDLDLSSINVKSAKIVTCEIEGIVDEDDLRALVAGKGGLGPEVEEDVALAATEVDDPTDLKRIREKHHSVARLVAKGLTQRLVASITGYTESYLSILLNNPAMVELVETYRIQNGAVAEVIAEKLRLVGLKALERVSDKIDADALNNNELLQAAKLGLDRAGHGPSSTQKIETETHIFDHAAIQEQMRKAKGNSREYIIPVRQVRDALLPAPEVDNEER